METEIPTKTKWVIDPMHSEIGFKIKHLMFTNVRGTFKEYDASIYLTDDNLMTAEIDVWINPSSINTNDEKRDEHLRGPDFFAAEKYKEIHFIGNTYEKVKDNLYNLYGDLMMKGIKKQIKLGVESGGIVKDPWGNEKAVFHITGKISRKDFGLEWNTPLEKGGMLLCDEVKIDCEIQLRKQ